MVYVNFERAFFVRLTLLVLNLTYMPAAAGIIKYMHQTASVKHMFPHKIPFVGSYNFGYILMVPLIQFVSLRAIQSSAITDILTWPGKRAHRAKSPMAKRYGTLYLRQQIHLDARLVGGTLLSPISSS